MPVVVPGLANVTDITAGWSHVCAVASGTVKCWGENSNGGIGDGSATLRTSPTTATGVTGITEVTAGGGFTCAREAVGGTAQCWGYNISGMLADGTTMERRTAVSAAGVSSAVEIVAGDFHSCSVASDSTVKCWGSNDRSQLGFTTSLTYQPFPSSVAGL